MWRACTLPRWPISSSPVAQSAEDRELKERLTLAVERLRDTDPEVQRLALELLRKEVRESTR
jgi:hypothetical protein